MRNLVAAIISFTLAFGAAAQVTTNPSATGVAAPQSAVAITGGTINGPMAVGGAWTAAATWTVPALTLGGAVTGNGQNISGLGTLGSGAITSTGAGTFSAGISNTNAINTDSTLTLSGSGAYNSKVVLNAAGGGTGQITSGASTTLVLNAPTGYLVQQAINYSNITTVSSIGLAVTGTITASAIASSGAAQSGYLCYNTTGGVITYDGGATCLISREEYKNNTSDITNVLPELMKLKPFWGSWKADAAPADKREQPFLGARHTGAVDMRLVSVDAEGEPLGVRYENMVAVLVAAVQELNGRLARLEAMKRHKNSQRGNRTGPTTDLHSSRSGKQP